MITFATIAKDGNARVGRITTPHGIIETPVFMPVGTAGSVKSLTPEQIIQTGAQIILANTYHLYLRPGVDVLQQFGGLHHFMHWHMPLLTDSGGFQVFSLSNGLVKITEDGVEFTSHIDGSKHFFTPEKAMEIQHVIGADIIMAFDEALKDDVAYAYARDSILRTDRWLDRCIDAWHTIDSQKKQSLFGIIQGGKYKDLRIESAKRTAEKHLEGIAIGGESIGYNKDATKDIIEWISPYLPQDIPHYTMGVGDIDDIFEVVARGIDMFDCVSPTRLARNGALLISPHEGGGKKNKYRIDIEKACYAKDQDPIDKSCRCYTCQNFSRAYVHHLFRSHELLANTLATIHNVTMLASVCAAIRDAIQQHTFLQLKAQWVG